MCHMCPDIILPAELSGWYDDPATRRCMQCVIIALYHGAPRICQRLLPTAHLHLQAHLTAVAHWC